MISKRAERRHHYQRLKKKRKKEFKMRGDDPSERQLGYAVSVHNAGCSCSMCGNPRKFYKEKTIQERKQDARDRDE